MEQKSKVVTKVSKNEEVKKREARFTGVRERPKEVESEKRLVARVRKRWKEWSYDRK